MYKTVFSQVCGCICEICQIESLSSSKKKAEIVCASCKMYDCNWTIYR